jgi:hypothetical protein
MYHSSRELSGSFLKICHEILMRSTLVESIQDSLKANFQKKNPSAFHSPKFSSVETSPRLGTESEIFGKIENLILKFPKLCHEVLTGSTLLESYLGQ